MYVVGSRQLMPPDALQPKAYCTNPGLQSFLLAPSDVCTRDPSSERRNYLGEKWPVIWTESCDFHAYTSEFFYMPQICDMGQTALLPFRRKACWGFFSPWKIQPVLNPRTWAPKASTLPLDHRSHLNCLYLLCFPSEKGKISVSEITMLSFCPSWQMSTKLGTNMPPEAILIFLTAM